ncbi:MAG: antitoxin family protein [Crocosphaera sp.]|nr:antitoxin family protein [Crocosphaera sp.]
MSQTINAIYENGVFRPLNHPNIPEGQTVQLSVEIAPKLTPEEMLQLASSVYENLSSQQIDEIEEISLKRDDFFEV